jgi:chromosome segregation ATPase
MLDKLRETIGTWLAVQLAPYIVKPPEPAAEADPKPYVDPEKADLMVQVKEQAASIHELEEKVNALESERNQLNAENGELTAQRDRSTVANLELSKEIVELRAESKRKDARIKLLDEKVRDAWQHAHAAYNALEDVRSPG